MRRIETKQLNLADLMVVTTSNNDPTVDMNDKVVYNGIHVQQATFKAGLASRVHRWFRLTPSFGPDLVQEMLSTLECGHDDVVLDPFAGAGTTMIECQLEGLSSYGFEINPFLHFVGETSLEWNMDPRNLENSLTSIEAAFYAMEPNIQLENLDEHGLVLPPIHNPTRWWRPDVLRELLILKRSIEVLQESEAVKRFFKLALAGVLVPDLTNVTLGRLQFAFIERDKDVIRVLPTFSAHAHSMIEDIKEIRSLGRLRTSQVYLQDSTELSAFDNTVKVNCVITSPPYPNRYSYVWNTRPHLYLLDFMSTPTEAGNLDKKTIGGTWGTATSILAKGEVQPLYPIVQEVVGPIAAEIREADNLMANYAMKYFNLLCKQIVEMEKVVAPDARLAYVVGCSRLKGVYVETDVLLGKLMEGLGLGYVVKSIDRIRKRHSDKDLHESIVYAWKRP